MSHLFRFAQAASLAAILHQNQRRKDANATPYINHPLRVAEYVTIAEPENIDAAIAAVLHDVVEDTPATLEDVSAYFGPEIAAVVAEVSDDKSLAKADRKKLQIIHAAQASHNAKLVKLADKLDNCTDLEHSSPLGWSEETRLGYFIWSSFVVDAMRGTNAYLESKLQTLFDRVIPSDIDRQAALENYYTSM